MGEIMFLLKVRVILSMDFRARVKLGFCLAFLTVKRA